MHKLIIMRDQSGVTGKDIHDIKNGSTLIELLMRHFPDGIDRDKTKIYLGLKEASLSDFELMQAQINSRVTVVMEAKALSIPQLIYVAIAAAAVSYALAPSIPGNVGTVNESPNNTLQGQTNIARPYQAYPLIFGSPISYPDLTGEAITEYITNQKIVTQLMVVGVGLFDITETRAGGTPVTNFSGASATYYEPVSKVVTVPEVINVFSVNEIDGQELLGVANDVIAGTYNLTEEGSNLTTYVLNTFTFLVIKDTDSDLLLSDFNAETGEFKLRVNYIISIGASPQGREGTGIVSSIVLDGGGLFYTIILNEFNGEYDVGGTYDYDTPFLTTKAVNSVVGPIKIQTESNEFWTNITFTRGLKTTVSLRFVFQPLMGKNGPPVAGPFPYQTVFDVDFTADTLDQQFRTYKQLIDTTAKYFEITVVRLDTGTNDANSPDQTTLEAIYAVNRETNVNYGNLTMLEVVMPATVNATSLRENKINIDLTSKLITYDGVDVITTPAASRKFADALLHMYVEFYGLDSATLDLDELYEIQNRLDLINPSLATFDFTFDDIDVSMGERMDAILQVARCTKWLDGDVYRFTRDEARAFESTVISRSDITAEENREFSMVYNPQLLESFDSVKVEYVDPITNKKAYIFRAIDGAGLVIDAIGKNPKSMEIAGCREEFNAINRAELEIRKLIYQRWILTDTLLSSAMLLDKGDLILYAEQYNNSNNIFDGEILAIVGDIATTSESIIFDGTSSYLVNYTLDDGSKVGPFAITEVVGEPFKFQCNDLTSAYLRDSSLGFLIQSGSRYIINTAENIEESQWTITEKEPQGENVQVSMINYDVKVYEFDGV